MDFSLPSDSDDCGCCRQTSSLSVSPGSPIYDVRRDPHSSSWTVQLLSGCRAIDTSLVRHSYSSSRGYDSIPVCIMKDIKTEMDLTKSIWKRTGNMSIVFLGGFTLLLCTSDSINWCLLNKSNKMNQVLMCLWLTGISKSCGPKSTSMAYGTILRNISTGPTQRCTLENFD